MDIDLVNQTVAMMNPQEQVVAEQIAQPLIREVAKTSEENEIDYFTDQLATRDGGTWEGFETKGYVPKDSEKSGVTVGVGFDVGQMSKDQIKKLGLPKDLTDKLIPYTGLKGNKARKILSGNPLDLSLDEAALASRIVVKKTVGDLKGLMNKAGTSDNWDNMTETEKFVAIAAQHQYGDTNLVKQFGKGEFDKARNNLKSWTDKTKGLGDKISAKYRRTAPLIEKERGLSR